MVDRIGQQLGNYRLTRLLGQGGFAEVYLGEHRLLGTPVAIKVLHTRVAPEDMAQFQQKDVYRFLALSCEMRIYKRATRVLRSNTFAR